MTEKSRTAVRCNHCGADDTRPYLSVSGFDIVQCKRCALKYVNPRLNEEKIAEIYNKNYFDGAGTNQYYANYLSERDWRSREMEKEVVRLGRMTRPGRILDIGCAYGFFLEMARKHGWQVSGVEISQKAGSYARDQLKMDVFVGPFNESRFPDGAYDVVHADGVIEHLPDPDADLKHCARLLKKGGLICLGTPNIDSLCARVYREGFRLLEPNAHLFYFSPRTLGALLEKNGFEVVRVRYPYFGTPYCNAKELRNLAVGLFKIGVLYPLRSLFDRSYKAPVLKSPPFYGNRMMIYARKK